MGKGLVWNGVSQTDIPVVFMPLTIGPSAAVPLGTWPNAVSSSAPDAAYEVIGPQVFRFEYCYLLTANGDLSLTAPSDISGIAAIIADIAVIDPKSKVLLDAVDSAGVKLRRLNGADGSAPALVDYAASMTPGQLRTQWQNKLNGIIDPSSTDYDPTFPRPAVSGIRLYERIFYLSPPKL
jgi:hypothetical protein